MRLILLFVIINTCLISGCVQQGPPVLVYEPDDLTRPSIKPESVGPSTTITISPDAKELLESDFNNRPNASNCYWDDFEEYKQSWEIAHPEATTMTKDDVEHFTSKKWTDVVFKAFLGSEPVGAEVRVKGKETEGITEFTKSFKPKIRTFVFSYGDFKVEKTEDVKGESMVSEVDFLTD